MRDLRASVPPWFVRDAREMRHLIRAIAASLAVIFAAPFVGDLRAAIQAAFPGQYRAIVIAIVVLALAAAMASAAARIRERKGLRYGLLALALAIGVSYAVATSSGNPEVDAVEYFHFVEYGLLALLYHRVWRDRNDASTFALPILAGLLVGTFDEWFQWLVPVRVGELRDVLLNGTALVCGVLFGAGLHPPSRLVLLRGGDSRHALAALSLVTGVAISAFFHTVHLGHEVRLDPSLRFVSRFSPEDLAGASRDRAVRWAGRPPVEPRLSREDHYLSEARWHIQERNEAVTAGDIRTAWHEQLILEAFYAPVLMTLPDVQWPPGQRAEAEARVAGTSGVFSSTAHPHPIYTWSPALLWTVVAAGASLLWVGNRRRESRVPKRLAV